MSPIGILLLFGAMAVPVVALACLRWAAKNDQLRSGDRSALLPFDVEEPLNRATDQILNRKSAKS